MKKNATIENYMALGADCRLFKNLLIKIITNNNLLNIETKELYKISSQFDKFVSEQENKMLRAYPKLPNEYLRVFYGTIDREPLDEEVDKVVINMAKQTAENLFKK